MMTSAETWGRTLTAWVLFFIAGSLVSDALRFVVRRGRLVLAWAGGRLVFVLRAWRLRHRDREASLGTVAPPHPMCRCDVYLGGEHVGTAAAPTFVVPLGVPHDVPTRDPLLRLVKPTSTPLDDDPAALARARKRRQNAQRPPQSEDRDGR